MFNKQLRDCHVEIYMPRPQYMRNPNNIAKVMECEARKLEKLIRDHRSGDEYNIYIIREYKSICEFCGCEEERDDNGYPVCCQSAIEEYERGRTSNERE